MILINPHGGKGLAAEIWERVQKIFRVAKIPIEVSFFENMKGDLMSTKTDFFFVGREVWKHKNVGYKFSVCIFFSQTNFYLTRT
jgi:hypothetical protein